MDKHFTKYAIVSALLEEKRNYLDIYYPFILRCFENINCNSLMKIHQTLKDEYDLEIPLNSIKDVVSRYGKSTFVYNRNTRADWDISLSKSGKIELSNLIEHEKKSEQRLNKFIEDFDNYLSVNYEINYDFSLLKNQVNKFIELNLNRISLNNIESKQIIISKNGDDAFDRLIVNFLSEIKNNRHDLVKTFDEIWRGTVLWNEIQSKNIDTRLSGINKQLVVYLDTNFILSLLELHHPVVNQAALELHDLLISIKNITLVVLDCTLEEIWNLLGIYEFVKDDYSDIEVDSIFYYMKSANYTVGKVEKLKGELIEILRNKFSIQFLEQSVLKEKEQNWFGTIYNHLFEIRKEVNEKKYVKKKNEEIISKGTQHDTSVIVEVIKHKDRYSTNLENCKGVFLTSSFWLFNNYKKIHSKFEKFPSVILDITMTNILFLKSQKSSPSLSIDQIIKAHSKYLIVESAVWITYVEELKELHRETKITEEDYSRLITKNQVTNTFLLNVKPEEIGKKEVLKILAHIKRDGAQKEQELKRFTEMSQKLNLQNVILSEDLKKKGDTISSLKEEMERLKREHAEDKLTKDLKIYDKKLKQFVFSKKAEKVKSLYRTWLFYFIFVFIAISCFVLGILLSNDYILKDYPNLNESLVFIAAFVLFLVPFIRSFVKHDDVKFAFMVWFSKGTRKKYFNDLEINSQKEFEKANRKPNIQDFLE